MALQSLSYHQHWLVRGDAYEMMLDLATRDFLQPRVENMSVNKAPDEEGQNKTQGQKLGPSDVI